jgi:hypothetical protein
LGSVATESADFSRTLADSGPNRCTPYLEATGATLLKAGALVMLTFGVNNLASAAAIRLTLMLV